MIVFHIEEICHWFCESISLFFNRQTSIDINVTTACQKNYQDSIVGSGSVHCTCIQIQNMVLHFGAAKYYSFSMSGRNINGKVWLTYGSVFSVLVLLLETFSSASETYFRNIQSYKWAEWSMIICLCAYRF